MPADISPYLADQIASLREAATRLFATAPVSHQAAIRHVLRELEVLPTTVAESYLLQALGTPANRLRAIEREMQRALTPPGVRQDFERFGWQLAVEAPSA